MFSDEYTTPKVTVYRNDNSRRITLYVDTLSDYVSYSFTKLCELSKFMGTSYIKVGEDHTSGCDVCGERDGEYSRIFYFTTDDDNNE